MGRDQVAPAVLLVGPSLVGWGAEGRFARLAAHLFRGTCDIAVLHSTKTAPPNRRVLSLGWKGRLSYPRVVLLLRRHLQRHRYDAVFSLGLFPNLVSAMAVQGLRNRPKLIISEITRPKAADAEANPVRRSFYTALRTFLYRRCDYITANSIDGLTEACAFAGVTEGCRLPNVIDHNEIHVKAMDVGSSTLPRQPYFVSLGRLHTAKRVDIAIAAFQKLSKGNNCNLVVVGDGEARRSLAEQVAQLNLSERVLFTGNLANPFPILKNASGLVMTSEYEGFSNAVLEAMFCDVPVITSLCSTDARQMCEQGAALGFEVGDVTKLSEHLGTLLRDNSVSQHLLKQAQIYRAAHTVEQAVPKYEKIVVEIIAGARRSSRSDD
jgi:glycosyltransferase involved in cell wall biosynthesis